MEGLIQSLKSQTDKPVCVGFGVSGPEQVCTWTKSNSMPSLEPSAQGLEKARASGFTEKVGSRG